MLFILRQSIRKSYSFVIPVIVNKSITTSAVIHTSHDDGLDDEARLVVATVIAVNIIVVVGQLTPTPEEQS